MPRLEISVTARDGCRVVQVAGELDLRTAPQLDAALDAGRAPGTPLVLDLARVRFLDSYGLRSLLLANAEAAPWGSPLRIVASRPVDRTIRLAGAERVLEVYPDREQALAGPAVVRIPAG
jgi:anti-anti-sigma factor